MKIDTGLIKNLASELDGVLKGGRVDKISQPSRDLVLFAIRSGGANRRLLISSASGRARIHLTSRDFENPPQPPMFCMLLRKHLSNAQVNEIRQENEDKVISIAFSTLDDLGRPGSEKLYVEMIPRAVNIILADSEGIIIDAVHRTDRAFPGRIYRLPVKTAEFEMSECLLSGISELLDEYYSELERQNLYRQKSKELRTKVSSSYKRIDRKLKNQRCELEETKGREEIRRKADLITANIYRIKKGDDRLVCEDFYSDNRTVTIELDPLKSPQENAARLYKLYNKQKKAEEYLTALIEKGEGQLDYLEGVLYEIDKASSSADIADIRSELAETGFLKKQGSRKTDRPQPPIVVDNILIGRNSRQNDELTFKTASKNDWWFHAKDYHGSHVILRALNPSDEDITKAASLAAKYSEASGSCLVDYCRVRNVRKPSGSLPGKVIYNDYKTVKVQ